MQQPRESGNQVEGEAILDEIEHKTRQPSKEEQVARCREFEKELVINDPDKVGLNFEYDFIVDSRAFWTLDKCHEYVENGGGNERTRRLLNQDDAKELLTEWKDREIQKIKDLKKYLSQFEGKLAHARVHPPGNNSPVSPSEAIEILEDGNFKVAISPEYFEQVRAIQEHCKDITLVVQFYDHRRGENASDTPATQQQIDQYVAINENIIENCGEDIQLEIGNETNVSKQTGGLFATHVHFGSKVDPLGYAKFYTEVAKKLKSKHPRVRLAVAGTAFYDPTYLRTVLTEIKKEHSAENLVDTISFHPYRSSPENGTCEVKNGQEIGIYTDYETQLKTMMELAKEFNVKLNVGEINFAKADPNQLENLKESISLTSKHGAESYVWPGAFLELPYNPEAYTNGLRKGVNSDIKNALKML